MTDNNRNLFITIILSVVILTLWQVFFMQPRIDAQREQARIEQERIAAEQGQQPAPGTGTPTVPAAPGSVPGQTPPPTAVPAAMVHTTSRNHVGISSTARSKPWVER